MFGDDESSTEKLIARQNKCFNDHDDAHDNILHFDKARVEKKRRNREYLSKKLLEHAKKLNW